MNAKRYVGAPILRREDERFLTGSGEFTDDLSSPGALYSYVLRSPYAHAYIKRIGVENAKSSPGVVAVYTADDLEKAGVKAVPSHNQTTPFALTNRDGSAVPLADQYPLARNKVRYVGEAVAFVVADSVSGARDGAERIDIDYDVLPAVTDIDAALETNAALVWEEHGSNQSFDWQAGDQEAVEHAIAAAAHVTRVEVCYPRVIIGFMEPRAVIAKFDTKTGRTTFQAGTQAPHRNLGLLSELMNIPVEQLHVVTPDMGGGFGARGALYPEFLLSVFSSRALRRTVRWTADRSEAFLTDSQARDQQLIGELALDKDGRFMALRLQAMHRHGAYVPGRSLWAIAVHQAQIMCGVYRFPAASFSMRGVFTNTAPVAPLRGVARAEAAYILERLVDAAARETGRDRIELRRRNLISADEMPWQTPMDSCYDSGDFEANLDLALAAAKVQSFADRREASQRRGRLRGQGVCVYIENTMGAANEFAEVVAEKDGQLIVHMGTQNFGMGHETVFSQVLADELGVDIKTISVDYGDTDRVRTGSGSHGSRSMRIGGAALVKAAAVFVDNAKQFATDCLEVAAADLEYSQGCFTVSGTDRSVTLAGLATFAASMGNQLSGAAEHEVSVPTYPNGCHVCEVEVDPETGSVEIMDYVMVADVGRTVNPMIVHGQLHGGLAQGLGHVLAEAAVYEPDTGQLLTGSFLDYAIPRADELPMFTTLLNDVPTKENTLGVKGAGEGPTTGSPPAMMNAILDALAERGITHIDLPATSEKIWHALRSAPAHAPSQP